MTGVPAMATVLFTDLVGSTALRVALGEERADELRRVHDRLLGDRVVAHGGRVVKGGGDGLLAAFTSASAALSAAVEMQQAVAAYNRRSTRIAELSVRIGLSAGDVSWEDGDCFGTPVVEAARLEATAKGGQILCSDLVRLMARGRGGHELLPIGELELKGLVEPVAAFSVVWTDTATSAGLPLPGALSEASGSPFVGRDHELMHLRDLLGAIERPSASVCWLAGEPGIGKTRLAGEAARSLHHARWQVLFGRCDETLQVPYQPFAEALRFFVAHTQDDRLAQIFGAPGLAALSHLCPDLARRLPGCNALEPTSDQDQYQLFEAVRAWLIVASEAAPVALIVDDAHWATTPTLLLINYLARTLDQGRVAIITTLRDTECPAELRTIIDESVLRPGGLELRLSGLAPGEVAALAGTDTGDTALYTQTAGNPLFIRALMGSANREATVGAAIRRRVSRLAPSTQEVLRLAALAGLEFDLQVVAAAHHRTMAELLDDIDRAAAAGLIAEADPSRCRFAHGLVRDALEQQLSGARRAFAHKALAEAHELLFPDDVAALARHWSEAALDEATRAKAVAALGRAGAVARAASDHDGAARAYRRALELVPSSDRGALAQFGLFLGRAQLDGGSYTAATERLFLEAAAHATASGLDEVVVEATTQAWCVGAVLGRVTPEAVQAVETLARRMPADPKLAARVQALDADVLAWTGQSEGAVDAGLRAIAAAEAAEDDLAAGWAHNAVFISLPYAAAHARRAHSEASYRDRPSVLADPMAIFWRMLHVGALFVLGDLHGMQQQLDLAALAADRNRIPFIQQAVAVARVNAALVRGRLAEAERLAHQVEALAARIEGMDISGLHGLLMFSIRREQGRLIEIAPAMRLVARLGADDAWRPGLAAIYAELGMVTEAAAELDRLIVGGIVDLPEDVRRPLSLSYLAESVAIVGDAGKASVLYELILPWSGLTIAAFVIACYGPVDRFLGMLALTMGDLERAQLHLESSLRQCVEMGSPTFEAHTRYWLARVLGDRGEHADAAHHLDAAAALANNVGMTGLQRRIDALRPDHQR